MYNFRRNWLRSITLKFFFGSVSGFDRNWWLIAAVGLAPDRLEGIITANNQKSNSSVTVPAGLLNAANAQLALNF